MIGAIIEGAAEIALAVVAGAAGDVVLEGILNWLHLGEVKEPEFLLGLLTGEVKGFVDKPMDKGKEVLSGRGESESASEHHGPEHGGAGAEDEPRMDINRLRIMYAQAVKDGLSAKKAEVKLKLNALTGWLDGLPSWEVRSLALGIADPQNIQAAKTRQAQGVYFGWMDAVARFSLGASAADHLMPLDSGGENSQIVWGKISGMIDVWYDYDGPRERMDVNPLVYHASGFRLRGISVNAEPDVLKMIRDSRLAVGAMPAPRRVRLDEAVAFTVDAAGQIDRAYPLPMLVAAGNDGPARPLDAVRAGERSQTDESQAGTSVREAERGRDIAQHAAHDLLARRGAMRILELMAKDKPSSVWNGR